MVPLSLRVPSLALVALLVALPLGAGATTTDEEPSKPWCEDAARRAIAAFEADVAAMRERAREFEERQAAERAAFGAEPRSQAAWADFAEHQAREREAFLRGLWERFTTAWHHHLESYRAECGAYEAEAFRAWSKPEPPVPEEYRTAEAQPVPPARSPPPPPPHEPCAPTSSGAEAQPATGSEEPEPATGAEPQRLEAHSEPDGATASPASGSSASPAEPCPPWMDEGRWQACHDLQERFRARLEEAEHRIAAERRAFAEQQAAERERFAASSQGEEETHAFAEQQAREAFERHRAWDAQLEALRAELADQWHAQCGLGAGPHKTHEAYAMPCDASGIGAWQQERLAFEETWRAKRLAFEQAWRERWERLQAEDAGDEAYMEFKQASTAARIAFEDEARAAWQAWEREHPPPMPCGRVEVLVEPRCDAPRLGAEVAELERHLRETYLGASAGWEAEQAAWAERERAFQEHWRALRAEKAAANASEEEWAALDAAQAAAWAELRRALEEERARWEARAQALHEGVEQKVRAELERFLQAQGERCWAAAEPAPVAVAAGGAASPPPPPPDLPRPARLVALQDDLEERRVRCMLEVRLDAQDFGAQQLRDLRDFLAKGAGQEALARFEAAQQAAREAFDAKLQALRADCERELRALHAEVAVQAVAADAKPRDRMGSFQVEPDEGKREVRVRGAHVAFTGDMDTEAIYGFTVGGQRFLDAIRKETPFTDFDIEDSDQGPVMRIRGEGLEYRFHDHPSGLLNVRVKAGSVELDVADYLRVERTADGIVVSDGERRALVTGDGLALEGDRITVQGAANFHVQGQHDSVLGKVANKHRDAIARAVEGKKVGAEVTVVQARSGVAAEPLTYEDMTIVVEPATEPGKVSVRIDRPAHEGRTVVLNVEKALLPDGTLAVRVFEVDDGGERDARAAKASSLADVLDPADDETPEYWVVTDEDGVQVLVSFPHFSEKRVEVESLEAQGGSFRAVPGLEGLGVLAALGAAVLVARRRA